MLNFINKKLFSGDKWTWNESISEFPSATYEFKIYIQKGGGDSILITSSANADNISHDVLKAATATTTIPNGNYQYYVRVVNRTDAADVTTIDTGVKHIFPNLATNEDGRSEWHKIYDGLMAKYEDMAIAGHVYTEIITDGRTKKIDRAQLLVEIRIAANHAEINMSAMFGQTRKVGVIKTSRRGFR